MTAAFAKALEVGKLGEQRVFSVLAEAGWAVQWKFCGHRRDITATPPNGVPERIEVNNEDKYADRNNACLELRQRGKPSGLMTSEATVVIHLFDEKCLIYRKQPCLLWVLDRIAANKVKEVLFGDNDNSGVLEAQMVIAVQPFAEYIDTADLPQSKVWRA